MKKSLDSLIPDMKELNFGIVLISVYYILEFGSIQGLFPVVSTFKIPYLVSSLSIVYALILMINGRIDSKSNLTRALFIFMSFMVIYSLISTGSSIAKEESIKLYLLYFANYLIVVASVKTLTQFLLILDVWLFSVAFSSYNGIFQGGLVWGSHWLNDENQMSLLSDIALPFAVILMTLHYSKTKKAYYILCIFTYALVTVIGHSRGGALGLALVMILLFFLFKGKIRNFLLIVLFVALTLHYAPPIFFEDMATLEEGTSESTADDRLYLWGIGYEMFKEHPIFGVGPMNYSFHFGDYELGVRYKSKYRAAHSTPIEFLAETGIVGVFFFLFLQLQLYKNWKDLLGLNREFNEVGKCQDFSKFLLLSHASAISQIAFHWCALFLSVFLFPFYWCLLPFSEVLRNICTNERMKISSHKATIGLDEKYEHSTHNKRRSLGRG